MDFREVPKKYRPIPFWSWNERLNCEETREQMRRMDEAGIGGVFMHARGGLQTEYMSEEWFENVEATIQEAEARGMRPWAYDENGWPSGFGAGLVNGLGVEYQQKYLRMEEENTHPDTFIAKCGDHCFYYEINPFYVDTLDKKVIKEFLERIYQPYYERFGNRIEGFFTDEPQISRNGIPWSFVYEEEYRARYGENILGVLEQLFVPVGDYKQTRIKFWKMVTDLFSSAFMRQIHDWCEVRGLKLTGHLVLEETLQSQLVSNGACMPHYEYFHIPGMDQLGRSTEDVLTQLQLSSVAEQLGKKEVISETFAMCGHNVSLAQLKGIYEWQMVRGVNLLCQHLEGYSNRGLRKRDYPPAMYVQQPWWEEYKHFNDAMSRVGMILRESEHKVDVLVLHPMTTAWTLCEGGRTKPIRELERKLMEAQQELERKHVAFHYGDETMMERHGKVENGRLVIGCQSYSVVVDPGCEFLFDNTKRLLQEFIEGGGQIVTARDVPENPVTDNEKITYTRREGEGFTVHYFVNTSRERRNAQIHVAGRRLDIYTGELTNLCAGENRGCFPGQWEFEPWGSLLVIEEAAEDGRSEALCAETAAPILHLADELRITECSFNSLTLDHCDYYFDGQLQERNGYVLGICERANALERPVRIHQEYHVQINYLPEKLYLACETPEQFTISVNGRRVEEVPQGYFVDKSFQTIEIGAYLQKGANTIAFDCDFVQSEQVYENIKKAAVFESEKNKLAYDMEIEAVYLLGDFGVGTPGRWEELGDGEMRYQGEFVIDKPVRTIARRHLEKQGYPFFCGKMVVEGMLELPGSVQNGEAWTSAAWSDAVLELDWKGVNAVRVEMLGCEKLLLTDNRLRLKELLGEAACNREAVRDSEGHEIVPVKLTLINNLYNLLGPHHLKNGFGGGIHPGSFFKEPCIWNGAPERDWDDAYHFAETGI